MLAGEFAEINGDQYVAACQGMDEETLFASDAFAQLKDALVAYALPKNIAALKRDLGKYRIDYDVWFHESTLHESGAVMAVVELEVQGLDGDVNRFVGMILRGHGFIRVMEYEERKLPVVSGELDFQVKD